MAEKKTTSPETTTIHRIKANDSGKEEKKREDSERGQTNAKSIR